MHFNKINFKTEIGQSMIEVIILLPLIISFFTLFFVYIYDQFLTQAVLSQMHEALVCESQLVEKSNHDYCLKYLSQMIYKSDLNDKVYVYKESNKFKADFYLLGEHHWKTITMEK